MRPVIMVLADGKEVNGAFYSRLISATIRDESGQESDKLTCRFDYRGYGIALPTEGTILEPRFGYAGGRLASMGKFTVDGFTSSGGPDGLILEISANAADMREKMKEKKSEHFDNTTLGAMLRKVFSEAGGTIEVDPQLAGIAIEYEARQAQSSLDFATRLADRHNAIFKAANGIYLMVPRGSQNKLSGGAMRALSIRRSECKEWEITGKPRPRYGRVVAKWHDTKEGKTKFETEATGGLGPIRTIATHFKSQADAKAAAKAEATRLNRAKGEGHFTQYGRVEATAEIDVVASGFGPAEDGLWRAKAVEHTFSKGDGFQTTIEVEAPESGKAS